MAMLAELRSAKTGAICCAPAEPVGCCGAKTKLWTRAGNHVTHLSLMSNQRRTQPNWPPNAGLRSDVFDKDVSDGGISAVDGADGRLVGDARVAAGHGVVVVVAVVQDGDVAHRNVALHSDRIPPARRGWTRPRPESAQPNASTNVGALGCARGRPHVSMTAQPFCCCQMMRSSKTASDRNGLIPSSFTLTKL